MKHLILHSNHSDPAMRYESLTKYALGADNELSTANAYEFIFTHGSNLKEINVFAEIIDGLIKKEPINKELRLMREFIEVNIAEKTSLGFIDHLIEIIEEH